MIRTLLSSDSHPPVVSNGGTTPAQPKGESTSDLAEVSTDDAPSGCPVAPDGSTDRLEFKDSTGAMAGGAREGGHIQQYELIRELGRGGMGVVHLARDLRLGRLVAIKMLTRPGHHRERFLTEARATARCRHENIVVIHEVGVHGDQPYLVFEYLRGHTLRQWMDTRLGGALAGRATPAPGERAPAPVTPIRAAELMIPVARALVRAHEMGIIHRDLKPANILLTKEGVTKVLDFGVAKIDASAELVDSEDTRAPGKPLALTALGSRLGTLPYMSPEQIAGEAVDPRCDIWAVGIILYELVTGAHPLAPLSVARLEMLDDLATPMPSLHERRNELGPLADVIDRCLLKHKEHRTATARELLRELEALLPAQRPRALDQETNPFAGLAAFQETDADRFFGRDHDIASIVARLRAQPLLAVTGASGAGKSSLVRAGVIPALKRSGEGWEAVVIRPGQQPLAALAEVLLGLPGLPSLQPPDGVDERERVMARLRAEPGHLGAALRSWAKARLRRLVLFIDQFEELYTLGASAGERACVLACLGAVADDAASPLRVMLSVRSDFLDRLVEQRSFLDSVSHGLTFLTPLDRHGLREALTRPVAACDHRLESPGMVDRILDELQTSRSPLPLLQFTADALWARRDHQQRLLTEASLRALGGVSGALASHADAVLASMPTADARLARTVFLRLITPERTRAMATMDELRQLGRDPEGMDRVLGRLIAARLLAVEGGAGSATGREDRDGVVEIIHESLIDTWPLLGQWLVESEEDALFLARLRSAARDWERSGYGTGLLWTHQAARDAHAWHQRYKGELTPGEVRFLETVFDEAERQRRKRRRLGIGAFAAITSIALMMSYLAWQEAKASRTATEAATHAAREAQASERVSDFLVELFEVADPYKAGGNQITARQILDRGALRIATELRDQPAIRARLMHIMGAVYGNLGLYPEATSLLDQALATRQRLYGSEHLEVAETQEALADVLTDKYEYARAEQFYHQALDARRRLLGEEHVLVADSMHGLAHVLLSQRKLEEARRMAQEALRLRRQLFGESHPAVAASLQTLGSALMGEEDFGGAAVLLRKAIAMFQGRLGPDALEVAEAMHLLANAHFGQKQFAAAEELIERSIAIKRRVLGENHVSLADGLGYLGLAARARGDLQRAEESFEEALGIYRASLEGGRMPVVHILQLLAQVTSTRGDFARAEKLAREALTLARHLGSHERLLAMLLTDLALALQVQGKYQEAEDAFRQSLDIHGRTAGAVALETIEARANLAALLIDAGDIGDATLLMQALEQDLVADAARSTGWLIHHIDSVRGVYLARTGQPEQAETLLQQSHAALQEQRGAHDHMTVLALQRLVAFYEQTGRLDRARTYRMQLPGKGDSTP